MHKSKILCAAALGALAGISPITRAATLFSDNFNTAASAANWKVNVAPTGQDANQSAEFGYDYSTFGIPAAPGSVDTLGMRLRANIPGGAAAPVTTRPAGVTGGLSVSPLNQNFGSNYRATFYAWSNFNGAANAQGLADNANSEGGTNNVMFGIGTSGNVPLVVGNTGLVTNGAMDGVGFATTGDGGITNDYRIYPVSGTIVPTGDSRYAATATANTNAYYTALFPSVGAPAVQQTLSTAEYGSDAANTQAGTTQAGAFGFAWHQVVLTKNGNTITWDVDGSRIATYDASAVTLGGNNIGLGVSDVNSGTTRHPSLLFTVFDNLTVTDQVPEPTSLGMLALAVVPALRRRRR